LPHPLGTLRPDISLSDCEIEYVCSLKIDFKTGVLDCRTFLHLHWLSQVFAVVNVLFSLDIELEWLKETVICVLSV